MESLVADLRACEAGQPAMPLPKPRQRRRGRIALLVTAGVAGFAGLALLWQGQRTGADGDWQLIVDEHFDRPSALSSGWRSVVVPGYKSIEAVALKASGWRIADGALIGEDHQGKVSNLARTDLPGGAIRASWTITPQISGLNLNCFVGASNRLDGYTIHVGGWGRPDYVAIGRAPDMLLDACTLGEPLRVGQTYRLELEFDRGDVHFAIDGRPLLSCHDPEPIAGSEQGGLGFEVSWNTVRIDDLRISVKPQERLVSPLAAADTLASAGAWNRAAGAYLGFVRSWPHDPLVPTARLRGAGALLRAGFADEAMPILSELAASPDLGIAVQARYERLRALAPRVPDDVLDTLVARLAETHPGATMGRLALTTACDAVFEREPDMSGDQVVALVGRMRHWSADLGVDRIDEMLSRCAERLNKLGRHGDVISLVPEPMMQHADALLALARYDEVHRRFPGIQWARYMAFSDTCRYDDGVSQLTEPFLRGRLARESGAGPDDPGLTSDFDRAFALAQTAGSEAALARYPQETKAVVFAMLGRGQPAVALTVPGIEAKDRGLALLQLGRYDDAAKDVTITEGPILELRGCRAIAALAAGDAAEAVRQAILPATFSWSYESRWSSHVYDPTFGQHFAAFVLPALVAWQTTGTDPLPAWRELAASQRQLCSLRVDHRWLGLLGASTAASILDQPFRSGGHPLREAALVTAVRADLSGDPAAGERWQAYLQLASPFDVAARAWASQRLARLGVATTPP